MNFNHADNLLSIRSHTENIESIRCMGTPILTYAKVPEEGVASLEVHNLQTNGPIIYLENSYCKTGNIVHFKTTLSFDKKGEIGEYFQIEGLPSKLSSYKNHKDINIECFCVFYCTQNQINIAFKKESIFFVVKMDNGDYQIIKRINQTGFTVFVIKSDSRDLLYEDLNTDFNVYKKSGFQLATDHVECNLYYFMKGKFPEVPTLKLHECGLLLPAVASRKVEHLGTEATLEENIFVFIEQEGENIHFVYKQGLMSINNLAPHCSIQLGFSYIGAEGGK